MHAISSYHGNRHPRPRPPQTRKHTDRTDYNTLARSYVIIIIIIIIIPRTIFYSAVIMITRSLREFTRFICWMYRTAPSGCRRSDQATWLGLLSPPVFGSYRLQPPRAPKVRREIIHAFGMCQKLRMSDQVSSVYRTSATFFETS